MDASIEEKVHAA